MNTKTGLIILAAGEGKRIQADSINKVVMLMRGKPMIVRIVELALEIGVSPIVVVVGFAKESVISALRGYNVVFCEQKERLGTAHALTTGFERMDITVQQILVLNGDDAFFLSSAILKNFIHVHTSSDVSFSMLTMELDNPFGIGRVVRSDTRGIIRVVEEKDATDEEKKIQEVNGIGYIFNRKFLETYLPLVEKSQKTGEYYLTSLIELATKNNEKIGSLPLGKIPWRGVNTLQDLQTAEQLFKNSSN